MKFITGSILVVASIALLCSSVNARKLPSYIQTCKKSDPKFDECAIKALDVARPYLAKGISKLRIPPLEPLHIPSLQINRNADNINIKATLTDVRAYGATGFVINKLKIDPEKIRVDAEVAIPKIHVTTDYDVDGRLLVIPLTGKGFFKGNFTDVIANVKANGELATNAKGVKHFVIKTLKIKVKVGDQDISIKDNNRNNEAITQTATTFVNNNRRQVLDIVSPIVEDTAEAFAIQLGNSILKNIPASELLPE